MAATHHRPPGLGNRRVFSALLGTLALLPLISFAARPVDPPSVELTRGSNNVLAATVIDKPNLTHINLRVDAVLSGSGEGEFSVRGEPEAFGDLSIGQRYLVAFTRLAATDQFRDAKFLDPEGPRVLRLRGSRVATVFPDTPELRFLFSRARGEDQPSDRERLDAILALIEDGSARNRAFAVEELYLRNELPALFEGSDIAVVRKALGTLDLPVQQRQFLIEVAAKFPAGPDAEWLHEEHRLIVMRTGPEFDLVTAESLLVVTALEGLAAVNDPRDLPVILPMLGANSPAAVAAALDTAHAMDAEATLAAVQMQLERSLLSDSVHADSRRLLERYLLGQLGVLEDDDAR